jgi:signal transduction histidine kinase
VVEFHIDLIEGTEAAEQSPDTPRKRAQSLLLEVVMAFSLGYRLTLEELEHSNQELAQVSRFKSRMLSMVAHDLTNHITAIKIFATGIAHQEDGSIGRYAQNILEVIKDQEVLIQNLLDIGRIDTGRLQLTISPQPLMTLIERAVNRLSRTSTTHSFSIVGGAVHVLADRAKLQQVLDNLIGNAVKYSPEGGAVEVVVDPGPDLVTVEVRDHGMGIEAADLPHIFEPFYRGSIASHSSINGTGLGLSIVKSLVVLQGGTIQLDSVVGQGTTVRFTLPLAANISAPPRVEEVKLEVEARPGGERG